MSAGAYFQQTSIAKEDIRHNRDNIGERLGFLGRATALITVISACAFCFSSMMLVGFQRFSSTPHESCTRLVDVLGAEVAKLLLQRP